MPTRIERLDHLAPYMPGASHVGPPPPATDVTRSWTHRTGGGATVSGPHPYVPQMPPSAASSPYAPSASVLTQTGLPAAAPPASIWTKVLVAVASAALVVALIAAFFAMRGSLAPLPVAATTIAPPKATAVPTPVVTTVAPTAEATAPTPLGVVSLQGTNQGATLPAASAPPTVSAVSTGGTPTSAPTSAGTAKPASTAKTSAPAGTAAKPRVATAKADPCAVPYTRDDKGVKIYKPECLQ
jgi:hypothetical protein